MPCDEGLAERIREILAGAPDVSERRMFGGLAFLQRGHMFAGILGQRLMARVGPGAHAEALAEPHVRKMDFTGKPLRGYVYVDPAGLERDADLARWIERCRSFVAALPPKRVKPARPARKK